MKSLVIPLKFHQNPNKREREMKREERRARVGRVGPPMASFCRLVEAVSGLHIRAHGNNFVYFNYAIIKRNYHIYYSISSRKNHSFCQNIANKQLFCGSKIQMQEQICDKQQEQERNYIHAYTHMLTTICVSFINRIITVKILYIY